MNRDVRIATNYPDHPKTLKLKKLLGADGVMSHIFLLCYVARVTPSGELKDMDAGDIAAVSRWTEDPNQFVDTLVELRLLDNRGDTYSIHNWQKHNYFAMTAPIRSEVARRNINKRWQKKNKVKQEVNTDGITDASTDSNTPSPSPSLEGSGSAPPPEVDARSQSPPVNEMLELVTGMYRGNCIDTTKERKFFLLYERATEKERTEVHRLAESAGVQLPANPYANQ